jgi:hypothetical protein
VCVCEAEEQVREGVVVFWVREHGAAFKSIILAMKPCTNVAQQSNHQNNRKYAATPERNDKPSK